MFFLILVFIRKRDTWPTLLKLAGYLKKFHNKCLNRTQHENYTESQIWNDSRYFSYFLLFSCWASFLKEGKWAIDSDLDISRNLTSRTEGGSTKLSHVPPRMAICRSYLGNSKGKMISLLTILENHNIYKLINSCEEKNCIASHIRLINRTN
ncbi:hypothetical protein L6164_014327 [Bauhinia variegata]|uniref:Uncharacterized protein n=1 Tax=Bauhinia variegata TaxID=167791 RepID=A0ACB9NLR8_BAUVA|nr:hypothetical protein L6164_014327 [Bauhinia variegata]